MIYVISGTNRPRSRTLQVAKIVRDIYKTQTSDVELIDIAQLPLKDLNGSQYSNDQPAEIAALGQKMLAADGLVFIVPEYNGSVPGVLKYLIDHWKYPDTFEFRPTAFVGIGGRFGGLRPVEHLQQIFGYRNAFIYPERVFLMNIFTSLKEGQLEDEMTVNLLRKQAEGFIKFVRALKTAGLDANTYLSQKIT